MYADLDSELLHAMALARRKEVASLFADLDLPATSLQWGFARVDFYGFERKLYEPQEDGEAMAFIIPVVEDGELVDLAAIDGLTEHLGQRHGHGKAFGLDAIERARWGCCNLHLVERPLMWLRKQDVVLREIVSFARDVAMIMGEKLKQPVPDLPDDYAYLFDLHHAQALLADVPKIVCDSIPLAERLQALLPTSQRKRVVVPDV